MSSLWHCARITWAATSIAKCENDSDTESVESIWYWCNKCIENEEKIFASSEYQLKAFRLKLKQSSVQFVFFFSICQVDLMWCCHTWTSNHPINDRLTEFEVIFIHFMDAIRSSPLPSTFANGWKWSQNRNQYCFEWFDRLCINWAKPIILSKKWMTFYSNEISHISASQQIHFDEIHLQKLASVYMETFLFLSFLFRSFTIAYIKWFHHRFEKIKWKRRDKKRHEAKAIDNMCLHHDSPQTV